MPTYQYACTECDHAFEQFQSFSDDALTVCPRCEGRLRKIFNAVGVVFKGSGFYRTDSRASGASAEASPGTSSTGGEKNGSGTGSSEKGGSGTGGSGTGGSEKGGSGKGGSGEKSTSSSTKTPSATPAA